MVRIAVAVACDFAHDLLVFWLVDDVRGQLAYCWLMTGGLKPQGADRFESSSLQGWQGGQYGTASCHYATSTVTSVSHDSHVWATLFWSLGEDVSLSVL